MGGQVLGGGVIVLVAVVLWLAYLLPSWHGRHQFYAAERNAVRLNQALRVLAETSETPQEVRLELNARTALAQQRLARQAQSEREQAELDRARAELAVTTLQAKADAAAARERAAAQSRAEKARPELRRANARRRARLTTTVIAAVAAGLAVGGGFVLAATGSQLLLWSAVAVTIGCFALLQRMSAVQRRSVVRVAAPQVVRAPGVAGALQDVALASDRTVWTPRELPRPLTASAGSRAASVLDEVEAREALRRAAVEEAMRTRAEQLRPPTIAARAARREAEFAGGPAAGDEAIEAHVRQLLERRASGQ
ncbi:MAG: large exoprotein [Microbacterium sp. SCN 70-200]|uniref:large exoprotein n=1 Tax=unclassified Microbacterium TaxID=2609290 RepID=UPI00086C1D40|nr:MULTISPECIES: large exoprotein [unclassified Microbacterium]MBN9213481.1 large exoprotein [Microbacterium sp.]ODT41695.1 MAG: large exoprotein [Microbacterium sp. SCN 70-200]OJV85113.1 MAG: large exoprotein [Microbacterium sp. 70-16]